MTITTQRGIRIALLLLALLSLGCPQTDAIEYAPGELGNATFKNTLGRTTIFFEGCSAFVQQERVGEGWVDRGGDVVCFWEGFAQPLPPGQTRVDEFMARSPGTWRLAYYIGLACDSGVPLSQANCRFNTRVTSNEFEVIDPTTSDEELACTSSGGTWDPVSCGHYSCADFPACDAIIPGCDCGPGANFEIGIGCVDDPTCPAVAQLLCESTGGEWDPTSCGHWSCGNPPICAAIIPGCNCGPFSVFDEQVGCLAVPCGAPQ